MKLLKMRSLGYVALLSLGFLALGVRPAKAVLVYGIVFEDLNGNGIRDAGENEANLNGITVTLTRDAGGPFGSEARSTATFSSFDVYHLGIFSVNGGGFMFDIDWTSSPYSGYGDLTGSYTLTVSLPSGYSGFTTTRDSGASQTFVGAGISADETTGYGAFGKFGDNGGSSVTYPDTTDTSGFDSDVNASGTYTFTLSGNDNAIRIDAGLTPIPEPANAALGIFAALVAAGSALRFVRARKARAQ